MVIEFVLGQGLFKLYPITEYILVMVGYSVIILEVLAVFHV